VSRTGITTNGEQNGNNNPEQEVRNTHTGQEGITTVVQRGNTHRLCKEGITTVVQKGITHRCAGGNNPLVCRRE